ncbi:MAG: XdhC family protein [Acidobacteriaceae bacterium]|nr:XdhC family protein [Acidobacteriaceae bacterium]
MPDRRKLVELWKRGNAAALVTLVRVEGSSYRRTGARLLIASDGEYAGAISGGCLEAEVIRKTQWKVRSGACMDRYSTLFDDTADIPYGLGCGGTVDLLLEPANTPEFAALMAAMEASLHGELRRVSTTLPEDGRVFARTVLNACGDVLYSTASTLHDDAAYSFDEVFAPSQRLFVFGAGDDAQPLVASAAAMGWRVIVIDGRAQWARRERFPEAMTVQASLAGLCIDDADAVAIMTHSYEQDREFLRQALPASPRYLGLLGARHRSALLLSEAAAMLGWPIERACEDVFAPMGLDLGGDGAEAIALATVAEIQASLSGKLPRIRRMTAEVVSEQIAKGGASRYLQTQCAL